jgi:glucose-6-phosphate 1-dehydrogenase
MEQRPLTIVIFGATGDLFAHKLANALFILFEQGVLPYGFAVVGFGRQPLDATSFRSRTRESIMNKREGVASDDEEEKLEAFLEHLSYFQGDFLASSDLFSLNNFLAEKDKGFNTTSNKLFHLAISPFYYKQILENISRSTILNEDDTWNRILIEKPFGKDLAEAKDLISLSHTIFTHDEIFHIDHYLAKETAISIINFRFDEGEREAAWNKDSIDSIKINFHESNVVGRRGAFYDKFGAFRDVGQNHMLQLLALVAMEDPQAMDSVHIRNARTMLLSHTSLATTRSIVRGQYEGYQSEEGVEPGSSTETFFRVGFEVNNPRWKGVVFELEGGKGLVDEGSNVTTTTVGIEVVFKDGETLHIPIQPVPGTLYDSYTKVYTDAIAGDQSLFVSEQELIEEWMITEEVMKKMDTAPMVVYKKGTNPEQI